MLKKKTSSREQTFLPDLGDPIPGQEWRLDSEIIDGVMVATLRASVPQKLGATIVGHLRATGIWRSVEEVPAAADEVVGIVTMDKIFTWHMVPFGGVPRSYLDMSLDRVVDEHATMRGAYLAHLHHGVKIEG